jgi:hypothetical protein
LGRFQSQALENQQIMRKISQKRDFSKIALHGKSISVHKRRSEKIHCAILFEVYGFQAGFKARVR